MQIMGHVWVSQIGDYYKLNDDLPRFAERWGWEMSERNK
jgi:hypothetical protein